MILAALPMLAPLVTFVMVAATRLVLQALLTRVTFTAAWVIATVVRTRDKSSGESIPHER